MTLIQIHIIKVCFVWGGPLCHFQRLANGLKIELKWEVVFCLCFLHFKKKYILLLQPWPIEQIFKNQNQNLHWIDRLCGNSLGEGTLWILVWAVSAGLSHLGNSPMTPPLPSSCCPFWVNSLPWSFLPLSPGLWKPFCSSSEGDNTLLYSNKSGEKVPYT